jgi:GTP cyclohydrolase I
MRKVYLSIGSNIGDRRDHLERAIKTMDSMEALKVTAISSLYETAPYGPVEQDNFYNACVRLNTKLEADDLLSVLQGIEISAGREKDEVWGPRTLDLDIVWMEDSEMKTERLTIPHKEAKNRLFVLEPLREIWNDGLFDGEEIDNLITQIETDPETDQSVTCILKHWVAEYGLDRDSHDKIESAVRDILDAVGEDPDRPGLK